MHLRDNKWKATTEGFRDVQEATRHITCLALALFRGVICSFIVSSNRVTVHFLGQLEHVDWLKQQPKNIRNLLDQSNNTFREYM